MKGQKERQPDAIFSRIELGKGPDVGDTEEGDNGLEEIPGPTGKSA